jgi:NADH:ubiquinone oxidoreductase subunit 5 (subunit L)/multisubunit Na+/H+ antiporter MnhA subunit
MENFIHFFFLIPFAGFLLSLVIRRSQEQLLSRIAFNTTGINLTLITGFIIYWIMIGGEAFNVKDITVYRSTNYVFFIDFYFDKISAAFLLVGAIITYMTVTYSRSYMHRESGFKRFFNTILFFNIGYTITVLAGNFETLFIGWEILGVSSFMLIAFYRLRFLPVQNAIKVFAIYRIGDVGLLLTMWMSHHLWHENITFYTLHELTAVVFQLQNHSSLGMFISLMILVAALAKSAQLPFSAWLPRAMEGPTPSSAIFYGSLSVHIGAFLLMRTHPIWEHQINVRWIIAIIGIGTAIIATLIARVQSTIKVQIAYRSAAQIGLIFAEIAAGFENLAILHFIGNAFLRTYQLLVSPSVVTYLVREQFYKGVIIKITKRPNSFLNRVKNALYILSLKEWKLDSIIYQMVFNPLKKMRVILGFLTINSVFQILSPIYLIGFYIAYTNFSIPQEIKHILAIVIGIIAVLMVAKAFNERKSSRLAWILVVFAHFSIDLAITLNDEFDLKEATIYLSGIIISGIIGFICLHRVRAFEHHGVGLNEFHGLVEKYPTYGFIFLLACIGIAGFPITTSFFGEDIILTHIKKDQDILATLVSLTFIFNGIAVIRIYARVFLGHISRNYQHTKSLTN